jgi:hypothetical protein
MPVAKPAGRTVAGVGDQQVVAGLLEEPRGLPWLRRLVEQMRGPLDRGVVAAAETDDAHVRITHGRARRAR